MGLAWFLWRAIYDAAPTAVLGGFTFRGMILYMVVVVLLRRVVRGAGLDTRVSNDIYLGGLNRYLVLPVRYLPVKYAQHIGTLFPTLVQFVVFALAFVLLIGIPDDVAIRPANVAACVLALAVASFLYFMMTFVLECVAFWAENVWSLLLMLEFIALFLGGRDGAARAVSGRRPHGHRVDAVPHLLLDASPRAARQDRVAGLCAPAGGRPRVGGRLRLLCRWIWHKGALRYSGVGI